MFVWKAKGELNNVGKFLKKMSSSWYDHLLEYYAKKGVDALAAATPVDTGKTASSWSYEIQKNSDNQIVIGFNNSNINKKVPIALVIQYGHGTGTGGWVEGRDYINPALQPVFDQMAQTLWKEVTSA